MADSNPRPDFNNPESINEIFNAHPDPRKHSENFAELVDEVEMYALHLAIKESEVIAYIKSWMPEIATLEELMQSAPVEIPTMPDLITELQMSRIAVSNDESIPNGKRSEIIHQLDITVSHAEIITEIAARMLYPDLEMTKDGIKESIICNVHFSNLEKDVLVSACNELLTDE